MLHMGGGYVLGTLTETGNENGNDLPTVSTQNETAYLHSNFIKNRNAV